MNMATLAANVHRDAEALRLFRANVPLHDICGRLHIGHMQLHRLTEDLPPRQRGRRRKVKAPPQVRLSGHRPTLNTPRGPVSVDRVKALLCRGVSIARVAEALGVKAAYLSDWWQRDNAWLEHRGLCPMCEQRIPCECGHGIDPDFVSYEAVIAVLGLERVRDILAPALAFVEDAARG